MSTNTDHEDEFIQILNSSNSTIKADLPCVMTVAGSDSSGGAGIEADLKTISAHGCYGLTVITALTAQNTKGVKQTYPVSDKSFISALLDANFQDIDIKVIKTGMLTSSDTISILCSKIKEYNFVGPIVVDPVMISTSGFVLLPSEAISDYIQNLFPLSFLITPNILEARFILSYLKKGYDTIAKFDSLDDVKEAAKILQKCGPQNVLIKGGHQVRTNEFKLVDNSSIPNTSESRTDYKVFDVLYLGKTDQFFLFESPYVESNNTHGTGCTLASAIASNLAKKQTISEAIENAITYVHGAILTAPEIGHGYGPINHSYKLLSLPFQSGHFVEYLINHPKVQKHWDNYVNHPFVHQIGENVLDIENFKYFLKQDYLYLIQYARAHSLAGYKATDLDIVTKESAIVQHIAKEMEMHLEYCESFGISKEMILKEDQGLVTYAYTKYLLDVGHTYSWFDLKVALSPCLLGYGVAADNIVKDQEMNSKKSENRYWRWIEQYTAIDYLEASAIGKETLEVYVLRESPEKIEHIVDIFATVTKMEIAFWDQALNYEK